MRKAIGEDERDTKSNVALPIDETVGAHPITFPFAMKLFGVKMPQPAPLPL